MHNEYGDLTSQFKNSLRFPQSRPVQQSPLSPIRLSNAQTIRSAQNITIEPQRSPNINYSSINSATARQQQFSYYQSDNSKPRETFRDYIASNVIQSQPISNYSVTSPSQGVVQKLSLARDSNAQYRSYNFNSGRPDVSPQIQRAMQFKTLASTYDRGQPSGGLLPTPVALHNSNPVPSYNIYESTQFIGADPRKLGLMSANDSIVGRRISIDFSKSQAFGGPRESFTGNQPVAVNAHSQIQSYQQNPQRSQSSNVFYETTAMTHPKPIKNDSSAIDTGLQQIAQNNSIIRSMSREKVPQLNLSGQTMVQTQIQHQMGQSAPNHPQQHFQAQKNNNGSLLNGQSVDLPNDNFFQGINVPNKDQNRPQFNLKGLGDNYTSPLATNEQFVVRSPQVQAPLGSYYKTDQNDPLNRPLFSDRPSITNNLATDRPSIANGGIRAPRRSISPNFVVQSERKIDHESNRSRSKSILKNRNQSNTGDQTKRKKSVTINEANNTVETYKKYLKKMYNSMQNIPQPESPEPPQLQPLAQQNPVNFSTIFTRTVSANEYQTNGPRN